MTAPGPGGAAVVVLTGAVILTIAQAGVRAGVKAAPFPPPSFSSPAPPQDSSRGRQGQDRVLVPAGSFVRGSARGDEDERPVRNQVLPAFSIDKTEVTRTAYAACVRARRCKAVPAHLAGAPGVDGNLPVTGVSWFDARNYCAYAAGRLPTEAEWEKAARGTDGREFPWGGEAECARANWGNFDGEGPCAPQNPGFPVVVGRYPDGASPYGAVDMAGNVWEWVADRYEDDPTRRVVRGGSCCSYFVPPRAPNRNAWAADYRDADLGFRCASGRGQ